MNNKEIGDVLSEIASLLELQGENPFKVRAFEQASRIIGSMEENAGDILDELKAGKVKGIGKGISEKIEELVLTQEMKYLSELRALVPPGLLQMLKIPGLGPKKIKVLYDTLRIDDIGALEKACTSGNIEKLKGFGKKSQEKILEGIEYIKKYTGLHQFSKALASASELFEKLRQNKEVQRISIAGSLRRKKEVVKDIDIVASSKNPKPVMDAFSSFSGVASIVAKGETKTSIVLANGINADLRIVSDEEFPFALHHFTGSKEHNTQMRARAKKYNLKMNEYGFFKDDDSRIQCRDEAAIFKTLDLAFIPPELREGMGEIEAAENNQIPELVEDKDLKGILHVHTSFSDGIHSLNDMVQAAKNLGYSYLGICDHSQSAAYAGGLKPDDIKRQHEEIDMLNQSLKDFTVLKGIESDILPDGALDYTEKILDEFDFVVASVHSNFNMDQKAMTDRIIRAMMSPFTTILGHPTGRLLLAREGYPVDMKAVIDAACEYSVSIELNSHPQRLDIDWRHMKYAKEKGALISINPDAHNTEGIRDVMYGVGIARKGWLTRRDVLNALPAEDLLNYFRSKKNGNKRSIKEKSS